MLRALVLCCSLKPSPAPSSSELLGREVLTALADHDVEGEVVRVVDHGVRFGVSTDEGDGEAMGKLDYDQAGPKPGTTGLTTSTLARTTADVARLLQESPYPA